MALEWHPSKNQGIDPSLTSSGSPRNYWWKCSNLHEYERSALLQSRSVRCPTCNSLGFRYPNLIESWDFVRNAESVYDVTPGSGRKFYWVCPAGHSVFRSVGKIVERGLCCAANEDGTLKRTTQLRPGENDLKTLHPFLMDQWSPIEPSRPEDYHPKSKSKVIWRCVEFGHDYEMSVGDKTKGLGCPICSNRRLLPGFNDLGTTRPELLNEWHNTRNAPSKPSGVFGNAKRKYWWICSKGHEWMQSPNGRHAGGGCPVCSNQVLLPGFNDLETVDPELAAEWDQELNHPLLPSEVLSGSNKAQWWRCKSNPRHSWQASPSTRRKGYACPYCAGIYAFPGQSDIATTHPDLARQIDRSFHSDEEILTLFAGSGKKIHWTCPTLEEHKYISSGAKRLLGNGCPYCSSHQVLPGFNDLSTRNPGLVAEWDHDRNGMLKPDQVTAGSGKRVHWICARDSRHRWSQRISVRRWSGCPECAPGGFSAVAPGSLYFLEHREYRAMKVGITATRSNRILKFQRTGWAIVRTWDFQKGALALEVETLFFRWIRKDVGLPVYLGELEMGALGGFSETFESGHVSAAEVISKIEEISQKCKLTFDDLSKDLQG